MKHGRSCDIQIWWHLLKMSHSGCTLVWHFQPLVHHIWMSDSLQCIICILSVRGVPSHCHRQHARKCSKVCVGFWDASGQTYRHVDHTTGGYTNGDHCYPIGPYGLGRGHNVFFALLIVSRCKLATVAELLLLTAAAVVCVLGRCVDLYGSDGHVTRQVL